MLHLLVKPMKELAKIELLLKVKLILTIYSFIDEVVIDKNDLIDELMRQRMVNE